MITPARRNARRWPTTTVLLVGLLVTLLGFSGVRQRERRDAARRFGELASTLAQAVHFRFEIPVEILHSIPAFFAASEEVSREEFRRFVSGALARRNWVYAFEWFASVPGRDRDAVEARARAEGVTGFEFRDPAPDGVWNRAPDRPEHIPLLYMEPPVESILGYDLAATPERRANFDKARDSGQVIANDRNLLVEAPERGFFIALYEPIYDPALPTSTVEERREAIRGAAVAMLLVEEILRELLAELGTASSPDRAHLVLTDESAPREERLLFESEPGLHRRSPHPRAFQVTGRLAIADREWLLTISSDPHRIWNAGASAWGVLIAGLLLTGLLAYGVRAALTIVGLRRDVEAAMELGQYTMVRLIGEGGMGVVHEARHRMLKRPAAIKLIRREALTGSPGSGSSSGTTLRRFEREARVIATLASPHTIQLYDFGVTDDGEFYYVMELLDGLDLESLIEKHGPIPPERAAFILRQVCHSLDDAHARGLIHRDIKPANIFTCRLGNDHDFVKVLDFGLVKEISSRGSDTAQLTMDVRPAGTPAYIAPEIAVGTRAVDARCDIYSLGCVGFWLVTGRLVFEGSTPMSVIMQHVSDTPPAPSACSELPIPPGFDALVLECLEKDPDRRPRSAALLAERLAALENELGPWTEERARRWWAVHRPPGRTNVDMATDSSMR